MSLTPKKRGRPKRTPRPVDMTKAKEHLKRDLERVRKKNHLKTRKDGTVEWITGSYVKWAKEEAQFGKYIGELTEKGKIPKEKEIGYIKSTPFEYGSDGVPSPSQIQPLPEREEWEARVKLVGAIHRLVRAAYHQETVDQLEKRFEEIDDEWVRQIESYALAGNEEDVQEQKRGLKLFREDVEQGRKSGFRFWFTKSSEEIAKEKAAKEIFIEKELVGPKRSIDEERPHLTKGQSRLLDKLRKQKRRNAKEATL